MILMRQQFTEALNTTGDAADQFVTSALSSATCLAKRALADGDIRPAAGRTFTTAVASIATATIGGNSDFGLRCVNNGSSAKATGTTKYAKWHFDMPIHFQRVRLI